MRKLASIQKISSIGPIPDADRIELLTIQGWHVVSQKNLHERGNFVVYCQVDSLMPDKPWFEDLRPYHHRIRTVRMRGQVSQGYVIPLRIFENYGFNVRMENGTVVLSHGDEIVILREGDEVTELLGITKYEAEIPEDLKDAKGSFPGWISKTEEIRVQEVPALLERYFGRTFLITEKLDGTSATVYIDMDDDSFNVCGRKWNMNETPGNMHLWTAMRNDDIEKKLRQLNKETGKFFCLQGEVIGPGVQKNKHATAQLEFRVFNLFDMNLSQHSPPDVVDSVCQKYGIRTVPLVGRLPVQHTIDELVALTDRQSVLNPKLPIEGLIFRPLVDMNDPDIGRLSFKIINPKFSLKYDE